MIKASSPGRNSRPPDFKTSQAGGPFAEVWRRGRGGPEGEKGLGWWKTCKTGRWPINLSQQPINLQQQSIILKSHSYSLPLQPAGIQCHDVFNMAVFQNQGLLNSWLGFLTQIHQIHPFPKCLLLEKPWDIPRYLEPKFAHNIFPRDLVDPKKVVEGRWKLEFILSCSMRCRAKRESVVKSCWCWRWGDEMITSFLHNIYI